MLSTGVSLCAQKNTGGNEGVFISMQPEAFASLVRPLGADWL
jgi:hypothetical protein